MKYYEKNGTVTHNSKLYDINKILQIVENKSSKLFPISRLKWILNHTKVWKNRIQKADLKYPIIITKENGKYIVIDGVHRLTKAISLHNKEILAKYISKREIESALL